MACAGLTPNVFISEIDQIMNILERGTIVTRFYLKKRPEKRTLRLRKETRQLLWSRTTGANNKNIDGNCNYIYFFINTIIMYVLQFYKIKITFVLVDLRDVKEVRHGRNSKEFDRWPDEVKKFEATKCFVIFHGNEFKLKTLSIVGM